MAEKRSGLFLGGVLLGSAIGAIAAIATDPRKTRQVRRAVRETADRLPEIAKDASEIAVETSVQFGRQVAHLSRDFREDWQATSQRLRDAAVAGVMASRQEYLHEMQPDTEPENGRKAE